MLASEQVSPAHYKDSLCIWGLIPWDYLSLLSVSNLRGDCWNYVSWHNCLLLLLLNNTSVITSKSSAAWLFSVYLSYALMDFEHWNRNSLVTILSVTLVSQSLLSRFVFCFVPPNLYLLFIVIGFILTEVSFILVF